MEGMQKFFFLCYATLLSVIGLFASDMYLPALAQIQGDFATSEALVGLSISIYMIGFAFAQLFYGPLSDYIGRKPSLAIGLSLFAIGTLGCIFATNIYVFLVFRLVQSIGVCAAYILWQPMIIDLFEGEQVHKIFTMLMALAALSPAIAPLAGGYVANSFGWETIFWVLQGLTLSLLLWTIFVFKESLPKQSRAPSFSIPSVLMSYTALITNGAFIGFALSIALSITLYLVYLAMIPFVLSGMGYTPDEIGLTYLPFALTFMIGSQVAKSQHKRFGDIPIMTFGVSLAGIASLALFLMPIVFPLTHAWQLIVPFCILTFANGFTIPTGSSFLMQRHAEVAGTCASSIGFLVAFMGFVSTAAASLLLAPLGVHAMTSVILVSAIFVLMAFRLGIMALSRQTVAGTVAAETA